MDVEDEEDKEEHWHFRNIGTTCVDCHEDIHEGFIAESFYPDQDCASCHSQDNWVDVDFDHDQTDWPLDGKHVDVACSECHFEPIANSDTYTQIQIS